VTGRFICLALTSLLTGGPCLADDRQAQLDSVCEAAREIKLAPMRVKLINECIEQDQKERDYCESYYADWEGNRGAGLSKLFYDLPECESAFAYQRDNSTNR
jgi:hypothetical protein